MTDEELLNIQHNAFESSGKWEQAGDRDSALRLMEIAMLSEIALSLRHLYRVFEEELEKASEQQ